MFDDVCLIDEPSMRAVAGSLVAGQNQNAGQNQMNTLYVQSLKKVVVRDQNISHHTEVLNSCARAFEPMCRAHNVFNDFVTDECSPLPPVSDFTKLQILMEIVDQMNLKLLPEYLGEFDVLFTSLSYKPQQDL